MIHCIITIVNSFIAALKALRFSVFPFLLIINTLVMAQEPGVADQMDRTEQTLDADVIVVGAGISGLSAAQVMKDAGLKVLLLEARDRLGGRTWTIEHKGAALDMGASWLHGRDNNSLVALAKSLNIPMSKPTNWENSSSYDQYGELLEDEEDWFGKWIEVIEETVKWYVKNEPDATVQMMLDDARKSGRLSFASDEQHLAASDLYIEHEFAAEPEQLSVQAMWEGSELMGDDPMPKAGYIQFIRHFAKGLDIRLQQTVRVVEYSGDVVQVQSQDKQYRAKQVLLTVPVGVLQSHSIEFKPQLPAKKIQALGYIGMGTLNKVWLEFDKVFWDSSESINVIGDEQGQFISWINYHVYTGKPYLLGFNAADYGEQIEQQSDEEIVEDALLSLKKFYGDRVTEPKSYFISRWKNDPFSRGSYSYLREGGRPKHRKALAKPVNGKLFFAGEATDRDFPSTTHGAYNSGLRAAKKIMALYPAGKMKLVSEQ